MMLTIEEFCGEEGIFENTGEQGRLFEPVFAQVRAPIPNTLAARHQKQLVMCHTKIVNWLCGIQRSCEEARMHKSLSPHMVDWG